MPIYLRMLVFALVLGLMSTCVHVYLYRRLVRDVWAGPNARRRGRNVAISLGLLLVFGVPLSRFSSPEYSRVLAMAVFGYMGILALLLPGLLTLDLIKSGYLRFGAKGEATDESKRQLLSRGVAAATLLGTIVPHPEHRPLLS